MKNDLLLHICCAPCATAVVEKLRQEDQNVLGFFHNPSIHPWKELQRRLDTLRGWAPAEGLQVVYHDGYDPESNIRMLLDAENRCAACFGERLLAAALQARSMGIENFTTTLLVSPYQNQEMIREAGMRAQAETGVNYLHRDFRELYKRSIEMSRRNDMYRQPYCGCIFSERDRYLKKKSPGQG